tara:strand:+ start:75 stop:470 length:396 start_codon:yes stop_codon:yes gene_type:complete
MKHTTFKISKGDYLYRGNRITHLESNGYTSIRLWGIAGAHTNGSAHVTYTLGDAKDMIDEHIRLVGHLMTHVELANYDPNNENCLHCDSKLGLDCGDAEPDFSVNFCSEGCYRLHHEEVNVKVFLTNKGDK